MTAEDVRRAIGEHFRTPARQDVIRVLAELPNFFEGWFTAEALFALRTRWPDATLSSNTNYASLTKPDIVFAREGFTGIFAFKHIATMHPDAQSRLDGAKSSNVAKDIKSLRSAYVNDCTRRAYVFYGPAFPIAHDRGIVCEKNRLLCIACSVQHLSKVLISDGGEGLAGPESEALLDDGTFHLLDFAL